MNTVNLIQLYNTLPYFFLIFFRISSFVTTFPMFSMTTIPRQVILFTSLLLSLFAWEIYPVNTSLDLFSFRGFEIALNQIIIGLTSGFIFTMIFNIFIYLGELMAMQTGLGFASLVDPKISQINLLGQFYWLTTGTLFLLLNGHLQAIKLVIYSFQVLPITATALTILKIKTLISFSSILFSGTILIALPLIISLLAVNIVFAVMTRAVPQLNIFSVSFTIILMLGLMIAYVSFQTF